MKDYETSIQQIKEDLKKNKQELLLSIEERFIDDLISNMVFYLFEAVTSMQSQGSIIQDQNTTNKENENIAAKMFLAEWRKKIKKAMKKELLQINEKLKTEKLHFLNAISDFSIASTEEYQSVYDQALSNVQKMFEEIVL